MRVSFCCICKSLGGKGKFRTATVKAMTKLTEEERFNQIKLRTRENFSNLYDIIKFCGEKGIHMYRVSSSMAVLHTHEICQYDFRTDKTILDLCEKIRKMCADYGIRLTVHCSQFNVIATDREEVFQSTVKDLQYHVDLMKLLHIEKNCIHVGSKKGGIKASQDRFISNFKRLSPEIQNSLMLENDDKSHNIDSVLSICETLKIPVCCDFHHDRCLPSESHISTYLNRIETTWGDKRPISHLSSSADNDSIASKHHDYISDEDWKWFCELTSGRYDVELECKMKNLALEKLNLIK